MARWGLGVETHPKQITARGSRMLLHGHVSDYPDNMHAQFEYPDGRLLVYENYPFTDYGLHGFDNGNVFYGTKGYMVFSRRGYFQTYLGKKETKGPGVPREIRGNRGRGYTEHMDNFLHCIRTRETPVGNPQTAHLSCALVHLGNIAYETRSLIDFNPKTERILRNPAAAKLMTKSYRSPYGLPEV
jgi:predicted dehydrogenase